MRCDAVRWATLAWVALTVAAVAAPVTEASLERAEEFLDKGQWEEAAAVLAATPQEEATRGRRLVVLTRLALARGDHEQAVNYGKQAVEALPASAEAHYRYAVALREHMSRISKLKAIGVVGTYKAALTRALELHPQHLQARAEEIGFLIHAPGIAGGSKEKARARIEELLRLDAQLGTTMKVLLLRSEGDTEGAIKVLREHLARAGDDADNRMLLAMTLQEAKRFREADAELEPLLAHENPNTALAAMYQLARCRLLGSYDQRRAVALLTTYLERLPEKARRLPSRAAAYWRLGQAHQQLGELAQARAAFQQALAYEPGHQEAAKALKALPKE
jgi:tetratricopeptide (TPR) repeat protein